METIKQAVRLVRGWHFEDPHQSRAFSNILSFFALMLVLTLVARGAAGAVLPIVSLESARRGSVVQKTILNGTVSPAVSTPLACPEGLTVQSLAVKQGDTLAEGQPIAAFEPAQVDLALRQGQAQLQKLNTQIAALGRQTPVEAAGLEQAQYAERWAHEEYDRLMGDGDASEEARRAAEQALTGARLSLEAAQRAYSQAVEAAQQTASANAADAALLRVQAGEQKQKNAALQALKDGNYQLTAPAAGLLTRLDLQVGGQSAAAAGLLADSESGYQLVLSLTPEQVKKLGENARVSVGQSSSKAELTLPTVTPNAEGGAELSLALPTDKVWKAGGLQAELTYRRQEYPCCVSPEAVHYEGAGAYVLLVRESKTVLGLQNLVVRMPVTVQASGDDLVAVSGAVQPGDKVIAGASRAVQENDRVRVQ